MKETIPNVLKEFADALGTTLINHRLEIPEKFGSGYCAGFIFNEHIRMMIFNYQLNEDLVIKNPDAPISAKMIFFKFQNIFPKTETLPVEKYFKTLPSVLIATMHLNTRDIIPVHSNIATINIEVDPNYLNGLFDQTKISPVLQSLLQNAQPLLFEQIIVPFLQKITDQIISESVEEIFQTFFLRLKAEELICRLLMELEKRDEKYIYDLNTHDVQTLYKVRAQILEHPGVPPVLKNLSEFAHMSPTKLKRLFRQIFGNSIFNYYQEFRMKQAALLLKDEKLSVAETGYRLGFTNLSHFSKVFSEHMGMKPKQYSRS